MFPLSRFHFHYNFFLFINLLGLFKLEIATAEIEHVVRPPLLKKKAKRVNKHSAVCRGARARQIENQEKNINRAYFSFCLLADKLYYPFFPPMYFLFRDI